MTSISLADFRAPSGCGLIERVKGYHEWQESRRREGTWVYDKTLKTAPLPTSVTFDGCGREFAGPNYCSQDYLSLASHPDLKNAAFHAIEQFGIHSAGSSALLGNTTISRALEARLAEFAGYSHALLFPTGWAAGYGVVKGLVRPDDIILMDTLSHACLQEGAKAATKNVLSFPHLDNAAFHQRLARARANRPNALILVITETLFSMDSDSPVFIEFLAICREFGAVSLVDVAHDMGCLGKTGRGVLETQGLIGKLDILIGSFSKTFASNGGFIATNNPAVKEYLKMYSCPQTFSNALSPVQVSVVAKALDIISSDEGAERRQSLHANSGYLRSLLVENGFVCFGGVSAIVPVFLGEDEAARKLWRALSNRGVASNLVEFPGVANNKARIRMQVQSAHTKQHAEHFIQELIAATRESRFAARVRIAVEEPEPDLIDATG